MDDLVEQEQQHDPAEGGLAVPAEPAPDANRAPEVGQQMRGGEQEQAGEQEGQRRRGPAPRASRSIRGRARAARAARPTSSRPMASPPPRGENDSASCQVGGACQTRSPALVDAASSPRQGRSATRLATRRKGARRAAAASARRQRREDGAQGTSAQRAAASADHDRRHHQGRRADDLRRCLEVEAHGHRGGGGRVR